jgi:clan AA aspartic protease (TIGR02281 family)
MKHLLIGLSLATLVVASPAFAGRYVVDQCSPNQGKEKWFLIFDTQTSTTNFSRAGSDKPRVGAYTMSDGITYTNVTNDAAAPMDLKLRPNHDPDGKPVLEWTSGGEESTMLCDFLYEKDYTPANWVSLPGTFEAPPPVVAEAPQSAPTCMSGTPSYPKCDDTVPQTIIPPNATASVPPTSGFIVDLIPDGVGGHKIDVILGTNTPVTMVLDTGATMVSLPQNIADQLVNIGEATVVGTLPFTIANGTTSTQNVIDVGKLTIGGKTIYHVQAGVGGEGSSILFGTNVLNRFGKFTIDVRNHQLILG